MAKRRKTALITGITGQDGSYLAELLLEKGYRVHGFVRRSATPNTGNIEHLLGRLTLHFGDLTDSGSIRRCITATKPDELYNLAAQSHVRVSFEMPEFTGNVTALGALRILEVIRQASPKTKFYQASSSEMFGNTPPPQNERSPFNPQSPYGNAKVFAYETTRLYRQAYGLFAVNGILFNHESPRRGEAFVTRKITRGVADIVRGELKKLRLGNLEARRDWGYAPEYMKAAYLMMQHGTPDDFVIGTGESHSIKEFLKVAFREAGLGDWKPYVTIDKRFYRPAEVHDLIADASKARRLLKWKPRTTFEDLVSLMVKKDR